MKQLVASESCAIGHPDKVADQISDAILDAYLGEDPKARVDITTVISHDTIFLAGEITSRSSINLETVAKAVVVDIGYTTPYRVFTDISQQSQEIAHAVATGAGDTGIMIGYASDETDALMPLPIMLANRLMASPMMQDVGPDGKALVAVEYEELKPCHIPFVIISCQHKKRLSLDDLRSQLLKRIHASLPQNLVDDKTAILLNPGGPFVVGGPTADTGITGRKLMCDTYGGAISHGGGAFSGKDPTKVDRSASYLARYIAKNIVAASLAKRCSVTLYYAIGAEVPIALSIDTFNTSSVPDSALEKIVPKVFDLSVQGIIRDLALQKPIYRKTAWGGHFGRQDVDFTWERTDKIMPLLQYI